jgi:hypothetical protein
MSTTTPLSPTAPPVAPAPKRANVGLRVGAVITGLLIVLAALSFFSLFAGRDSHTTQRSFTAPPSTSTLAIETGSADVTLLADSASGVQVVQHSNAVHGYHVAAAGLSGDRLTLPSSCTGGGWSWLFYCSVSYTVHVPRDLAVRFDVGSGDVTARGVTADLTIKVGSGDVEASGLGSSTVIAHSGSGDVRLGFASAPTTVQATSGSGDLELALPQDGVAYRIVEKTGSGDYTNLVDTSQSSGHTIDVETGSGDLSIDYTGS